MMITQELLYTINDYSEANHKLEILTFNDGMNILCDDRTLLFEENIKLISYDSYEKVFLVKYNDDTVNFLDNNYKKIFDNNFVDEFYSFHYGTMLVKTGDDTYNYANKQNKFCLKKDLNKSQIDFIKNKYHPPFIYNDKRYFVNTSSSFISCEGNVYKKRATKQETVKTNNKIKSLFMEYSTNDELLKQF